MAVQSGPPATSGCEPRQARKGATVAAKACAGMRLDRIAARPSLAEAPWPASERQPGEVSERSKEHAWKVCMRQRIEGSNPSLSANNRRKTIHYTDHTTMGVTRCSPELVCAEKAHSKSMGR